MPSQPDPNSPFLASRAQAALGIRAPGDPSMAGQPGVQPGGFNFPAPPTPAGGIPGRPTMPAVPTPAAPVPATPTPQTATPQAKSKQAGAEGGRPATGSPAPQPQPAVAPLGVPVQSADGAAQPDLALTPEGDMRYRQAVLAGRDALGPIPRAFRHPTLPELPYELGSKNYNPFTGSWGD